MNYVSTLYKMREQVKEELKHIPKGPRGSLQNILRSAYWMARMNSLKKKGSKFNTKEEALAAAIKSIERDHSNFTPEYDKNFFGRVDKFL